MSAKPGIAGAYMPALHAALEIRSVSNCHQTLSIHSCNPPKPVKIGSRILSHARKEGFNEP
jgi:hypothetical protein